MIAGVKVMPVDDGPVTLWLQIAPAARAALR